MKNFYLKGLRAAVLCQIFMLISVVGYAQVSGVVTDGDTGEALIGASVFVKGTQTGTITDIDGSYTVDAPSDAILVFSFVGYSDVEESVAGRSTIDVVMQVGALLDEVVVTGYASQQKSDLTGAVGVVSTEQLLQIPSSNITSQLQGRVSGVTVSGDGRPGQAAKVRIRGFSGFGGNQPLYVIDGVPTSDVSTLNPNDIESMSVLKDAGAASIYGSRAANGVILIKTKKGQSSGIKVDYSMYYGTQNPGSPNTGQLNTQEYADLQWLVYRNDGTEEEHPIYGSSTNANPTLPSWAADTDWWKVLTRDALIMNHDVSLSGGNENATFYAGLNYFNQEGIIKENFSKRFSARLNSEFKAVDGRLTMGENLTVTGRTGNGVAGNGSEGSPISMGLYRSQPIIPPIITTPVTGIARQYEVGDYGGTGLAPRLGNGSNVLATQERNSFDRQNDTRILGSIFMDFEIIEGLNARTTFGGTHQSRYNTNWNPATYENAENTSTPSYTESASVGSDWVWTNTLTFDRDIGAHSLLAVGGYESVALGISRGVSAQTAGFFSNDPAFRTVSNGASIVSANSFNRTKTTLVSYFLRGDYSYDNRYYLSATVRRDESSRFGENNRSGIFPSVSVGVRVSDLVDLGIIDDLKFRGGYGTMGNQNNISPVNQFSLFGSSTATSYYDINGNVTSSVQGFRPTRLGNPDTKWETQITTNVGFDASLLDSKMQISFDWYTKTSEGLLVVPPLPSIYGAASAPSRNVGDMRNTGIDLQLDYRDKLGSDFTYDATITFTSYKNEILKFADNIDFFSSGGSRIGAFNRNEVGQSISEFFGYQVAGLWQQSDFNSAGEVINGAQQDGAAPGFFRFEDLDGDGVITPDDRTFIGNPNPDFTYGLNLAVGYKGFDFSAFFFGSKGNDIFNYNRWWTDFWPSFQGQKSEELLYNSWTPSNTDATVPKASNISNFSTNTQSTSYYVEDGSFFRLKNLQIGYTLPSDVTKNIGLSNVRFYVQGTNLFTITNYTGLDADLNNGSDTNFGVDLGNYPLVKQLLLGLNVGF